MKSFTFVLLVCAAISAGPVKAGSGCADLALVLAVDSSSSIDGNEFWLQLLGYAAAFTNPKVLRALNAAGKVDVSTVFWADSAVPIVVSKWWRIRNDADAAKFAKSFLVPQRLVYGDTDLGAGLMAALDQFDMKDRCYTRKLVNVSGDGRDTLVGNRRTDHVSVGEARARADSMEVTVNGLAILNEEPNLAEYYRTQLITGEGSFVMEVRDLSTFGDAIIQKLDREIRPQFSSALSLPRE
jgi:Ca-activated chloride channel homolog